MTYSFKEVVNHISEHYPDMRQTVIDMLNPLVDFAAYEYESQFDLMKMHYLVCARILSRHTSQYRDYLDEIVARRLEERRDLIDNNMLAQHGITVPNVNMMLRDSNYNIKELGRQLLACSHTSDIEHYINAVTPLIDRWNMIKDVGRSDLVWSSTGATSGHKQIERHGIIRDFIRLCSPYMTIGIKDREVTVTEVKKIKTVSTATTTDTTASTLKRVMNRMQGKSGFIPSTEMIVRLKSCLPRQFTSVHNISKLLAGTEDAARSDEIWSIVNSVYGTGFVDFQGKEHEIMSRYNMTIQILRDRKTELNLTAMPMQYRLYMICRDLKLNTARNMFNFADETAKMVTTWQTIKHHLKW